ncbi:MAG: class I SAM-dependent methyltransferase [Candidatus Krumholzibacteria bacterium]|nr:class I SAM-dependent methyltransferase [Candidatus Krumholzibacteria bacterium]
MRATREEGKAFASQTKESVEFYERRFSRGYLEEWPVDKRRQLMDVLHSLRLPAGGEALDFGCGNGVLTEVVRQALPGWTIFGADISRNAIDNARSRFPECTFFVLDDCRYESKTFDLVFSHHVLEHVLDLHEAMDDIVGFLKPVSWMLHFLPCGNEGSFEQGVCLLRKDGIDAKLANRFFFEDEGHLRRLDTRVLCQLCEARGYTLQAEYYSNHYYGAIDWITREHPRFALKFTNGAKAVDDAARRRLRRLQLFLMAIMALRLAVNVTNRFRAKRQRRIRHYLWLVAALPFYPFSYAVDWYWRRKAWLEWRMKKTDRRGSEMVLFFGTSGTDNKV